MALARRLAEAGVVTQQEARIVVRYRNGEHDVLRFDALDEAQRVHREIVSRMAGGLRVRQPVLYFELSRGQMFGVNCRDVVSLLLLDEASVAEWGDEREGTRG